MTIIDRLRECTAEPAAPQDPQGGGPTPERHPMKTQPSEAQDYFERVFGSRPTEPYLTSEDPEKWAEIAEWEFKRAEFYSWILIHDDVDIAGRMVQ